MWHQYLATFACGFFADERTEGRGVHCFILTWIGKHGVLQPVCCGVLQVTLPRKTLCAQSDSDHCLFLHSLAGSSDQSCAGFLYVQHQGDFSGLLLHARSLKYLVRGKNRQRFWLRGLFRPESVVSDCPAEEAGSGIGTASWRHPCLRAVTEMSCWWEHVPG